MQSAIVVSNPGFGEKFSPQNPERKAWVRGYSNRLIVASAWNQRIHEEVFGYEALPNFSLYPVLIACLQTEIDTGKN